MLFYLKRITFFGRIVSILCQNENGPCPLLAIANVMLLINKIKFHKDQEVVSITELIEMIGNLFLESSTSTSANPHNHILLDSALAILPKLASGLDLNVHFNDIRSFEFTEELSVFDSLDIPLFHTWVIDPSDSEFAPLLLEKSYNYLMFKLVEYETLKEKISRTSTDSSFPSLSESEQQLMKEGPLLETFARETASQMTYTGLLGLYSGLRERQLGVLLLNSHFSVLFKHQGQLFLLATDLGYREEPSVVWELLDEINGNTSFFDSSFLPSQTQGQTLPSSSQSHSSPSSFHPSPPHPSDISHILLPTPSPLIESLTLNPLHPSPPPSLSPPPSPLPPSLGLSHLTLGERERRVGETQGTQTRSEQQQSEEWEAEWERQRKEWAEREEADRLSREQARRIQQEEEDLALAHRLQDEPSPPPPPSIALPSFSPPSRPPPTPSLLDFEDRQLREMRRYEQRRMMMMQREQQQQQTQSYPYRSYQDPSPSEDHSLTSDPTFVEFGTDPHGPDPPTPTPTRRDQSCTSCSCS